MENQKHGLDKIVICKNIRFIVTVSQSQKEKKKKQQPKEEKFKSAACNISLLLLLLFFFCFPQHFGHFSACNKKKKFLVFKGHINPPFLFFILEDVSMNSCNGD